MMMDCPRCGFNQPKDRYCANCGLDVEHFVQKPKPLWIRLLQNPNFHLSLIAILIVFVIGYIVYSRSEQVAREVNHFLGTPISSKQAADPDAAPLVEDKPKAAPAPQPAAPVAAQVAAPGTAAEAEKPPEPAAAKPVEVSKLDLAFWEVPRESLATLIPTAEKVGESQEGRVYLFKDGTKVSEALKAAHRIALNRTANLQNGAQILVVTPPQTGEAFQFGFALSITKWEDKVATVHWDSQLILSQPESPQEMASPAPAVKSVTEVTLNGTAAIGSGAAIMVVLDPSNRRPRDEYLNKAGEGPWSVFSSDDFRAGVSDWVAVFQLK